MKIFNFIYKKKNEEIHSLGNQLIDANDKILKRNDDVIKHLEKIIGLLEDSVRYIGAVESAVDFITWGKCKECRIKLFGKDSALVCPTEEEKESGVTCRGAVKRYFINEERKKEVTPCQL